MTTNQEVTDTAVAFARTLGLAECAAKSVEWEGSNCVVEVEGLLRPKIARAAGDDKEAIAAFLSEPFCLKIVVSCGSVLKYEWIDVQLS